MKIKYSKKRLYSNLLLGVLFGIMGVLKISEGSADYLNYFQLALGLFMIGVFFFESYYQYLKIENGVLTRYSFRRKSVKLSEVEKIRKFAGDYILFTSEKKLKINSELVNKGQTADLESILRSLDIPFEETPVKKYNFKKS